MENINILGEYLNMRIESLNDRDVNFNDIWFLIISFDWGNMFGILFI